MTGYKDNWPGIICFDSQDGFISMSLQLVCCDGLYYCPTNVFTLGHCPGLLGCTPQSTPYSKSLFQKFDAWSITLRLRSCVILCNLNPQTKLDNLNLRSGFFG